MDANKIKQMSSPDIFGPNGNDYQNISHTISITFTKYIYKIKGEIAGISSKFL